MLEYKIFFKLECLEEKIKQFGLDTKCIIHGSNAVLESIEFVNTVLELEEILEKNFNISTDLYDEILKNEFHQIYFEELIDIINQKYF